MLKLFKNEEKPTLDDLIDEIIDDMKAYGPDDPKYIARMEQLEKLNGMKAKERRHPVSWDTLITAGVSLLSVLVIVGYERGHVMTSKALPLIIRAKAGD